MATYVTIQTAVRNRIIDLPTVVTNDVPRLINYALRKLQSKHNFKMMETTLSQNTDSTAGDGGRVLVAVPSTFKEIWQLPYMLRADGKADKLAFLHSRHDAALEFGEYGTDSDENTGAPQAIIISEPTDAGVANFEVYPRPDANSLFSDGEYRIRIPYYRYIADLSADADTNWFTNLPDGEEFLIRQATAEGFFLDWDEERGTFWTQKAKEVYNEVVRADKLFRVSATPSWSFSPNAR